MPNIFSLLRRGSPIPAESPEVGAHPGSESGQAAENEARRRVSEGEAHSRAAVNEARRQASDSEAHSQAAANEARHRAEDGRSQK